MSRAIDESVGALLGALQELRRSGALSPETLETALRRVGGDMDAWIQDPDAVTLVEAMTLLEAAITETSAMPAQRRTYDSLTAPRPGRPVGDGAAIVGTVEGGLAHIADRLVSAAFLVMRASPQPADAKLATLVALFERRLKEYFDVDGAFERPGGGGLDDDPTPS